MALRGFDTSDEMHAYLDEQRPVKHKEDVL
jgi:hypothetical protein